MLKCAAGWAEQLEAAADFHMTGFTLRNWLVSAGLLRSMLPTAGAFAAGLAMPARDRCENFFVWHVEALRAAVLASGVVLPSCREFHAAGIADELRLCAAHMGDDAVDKIVQRICSKILADMLLAVPLEVRALVQLDVLEMIGMAVVEDKTGLVLMERAGVASSG